MFFIISFTIPLNPVDMIAATRDKNFWQSSSLIIEVNISRDSAKLRDSNPPDLDICSKIFSTGVSFLIDMSSTGLPE